MKFELLIGLVATFSTAALSLSINSRKGDYSVPEPTTSGSLENKPKPKEEKIVLEKEKITFSSST